MPSSLPFVVAPESKGPSSPSWRTTIHTAFDRVVALFPDSVAVEQDGNGRTYVALAQASRRLAVRLAAAGVGPGDVVGVCVGRSPEFVVSLLAILRCGAAYAPLPVEYPLPRLLGMLEDANVRVLVADVAAASLSAALEQGRAGLARIAIDQASAWEGDADQPWSDVRVGPESPAYVMFTSGSTGRPRGVIVPHRAVVGLVTDQSYADFVAGLRTLVLAPTAFDASTFELWAPLLHGGTAVVYPEDDVDPTRLGQVLRAGRVNCLWLTAGLFNLIVDLEPSALAGVAHVLTGGDVLSVSHVRRAFAALPGIRITNGYGPTETTTFACTHAIDPDDPFVDGSVPIGRPLAHSDCMVVDGQGRPVADGVEGELWIGGSGVALGYLSGDRTRFVADPRGGDGLVYRSGDRCRRRADGTLLFLGRVDREVKIRGHRVEPAELEAALAAHPAVLAAAVVPFGDRGDLSLGAVLVRRDGRTDPIERIRDWLAERLPAALLPARIAFALALPVTPNGKIDRDAMGALLSPAARTAPDVTPAESARRILDDVAADSGPPARGAVEAMLAERWQGLLGLGAVGRHDDFFDLGGNSLTAMRLVARIEVAMGVRIPVRAVFESPRLSDLAGVINAAILDRGATPPRATDGSRDIAMTDIPALPAQRGMWALHEHLPDRATYNQPFAYRLGAEIDPEAVRSALAALAARHPALRCCLVASPSGPMQRFLPPGCVDVDWAVEPGVGPESIDAVLRDRARIPFDLAKPPLWRARFFPDAAPHGVVLIVFHHAVIDDWSIGVFLEELATKAADVPAPPPAPACAIAVPPTARRAVLVRFWREVLAGAPTALRLPGARPAEGAGASGAILRRSLRGLAADAKRAAGSSGCTLAQWCLAAFQAWLERITVATDVVVLTPVSLRGMGVAEDALGCCLNTVPIRVRWRDDGEGGRPTEGMTLPELAGHVRRTMLDAGDHADLSFDEIVAETLRRGRPGGSLADILVVVTEGGHVSGRIGAAPLEPIPCDTGTAKFGATFFIDVAGDDVELAVEYAESVYDGALVEAHLSTFSSLLRGAIRDPGAAIESLPLSEAPPGVAVAPSPPPSLPPIHHAAIAFARTAPELPAVIAGSVMLSYADLDARSRTLAARLKDLGAVPEERVGICLPRGASSCVSLLAVLRAGAVCVPLDPSLPAERLGRMAAIAGVRLVVCDGTTARIVAGLGVVEAVPADGLVAAPGYVDPPVPADSLAYVLFTSGSTGDPKGVEMPHGPLAALFAWQTLSTPREPGERTLHFASTGFDVAFQEVFSAWAAGCTVVVADEETRRDPSRLVEMLSRERVDRAMLPTAMLIPLAEAILASNSFPGFLRDVIVAGERLRITDTVRRAFAALPGCRLWNHYGPTETHVVTAHRLDGPPAAWPDHPPIGLPIDGAEVSIVGPNGGRLPPCSIGEIVLGGGCLARGYASRPDLTAARFPGVPGPGAVSRTYRTGDLGWVRPDGVIECVGRNDGQIKLSGHRIEPGEVEAALSASPGVRRAAVVVRGDGESASLRLVAFLEVEPGWPGPQPTRARLRATLPEAMIPTVLAPVDNLPTNVNGKIDRRELAAMPIPDDATTPALQDGDPPRGAVEAVVAEEWSRILGVASVSRDDDFFELGGRSLPAMMIVAAINGRLGVRIPVRAVFDHPRLADLATVIESGVPRSVSSPSSEPSLASCVPVEIPALPAQRGMWVLQHLLPDPATYNQPWAFRPRGPVDWTEVRARLHALAVRHPALRTALVDTGVAVMQRISPVDGFEIPWREDASVGPDRIAAELVSRAREPFDIATQPLWRAFVFPAAAPHGVLLLLFHHAIIDDWSIALLLGELGSDAVPTSPGAIATLPARGDLQAAGRYWHRVLDGAPTAVPWPDTMPAADSPSGRGAVIRFTIPSEVVSRWTRIARTRRATLFHAWLGACHVWLQQATRCRDTVVLTPLANRVGGAVSDAVGCFVNTLPVRIRGIPTGATAGEVTDLGKEAFLDAADRGFLPFDEIVSGLTGVSGSRLQPVGNVAFVFLERDGVKPLLVGTPVEPIDVHTGTARFDLTLSLITSRDGGDADGVLEYSLDVLDESTARSLADRFVDLLARVAADPAVVIGSTEFRVGEAPGEFFPGHPLAPPPAGGPPSPRSAPIGATETAIAALWSSSLGGVSVARDDSFFELGGNSLLAIRVALLINRELGAGLTLRSLFVAPRLRDLAELIDRSRFEPDGTAADEPGETIVPLQPLGSRPPLVLIHGFGGGVSHFLPLAARLAPDIPAHGLLARELASGTTESETMSRLAARYADAIERLVPGGDIRLCSHSHGGWIAFEVARVLKGRGRPVGTVILLDTHPEARLPAMGRLHLLPWQIADRLLRQVQWLRALRQGHVPRLVRRLAGKLLGGPPEAPEWYRDGAPLRGFRQLVARHSTGRYDGRVDLVHASNARPTVVPSWRWLVGRNLRVHDVAIPHHELFEEKHADVVGRLIRGILDDADTAVALATAERCQGIVS